MYPRIPVYNSDRSSIRQKRLLQFIILILVIIIAVMSVFLFRASSFGAEYNRMIILSLRDEAEAALNQINSLSRTGGSATDSVLGKIRQHTYAAKTLSEQYAKLNGKTLVTQDIFIYISGLIDQFEARRQTGQPTLQYLTDLTFALEDFERRTEEIE